MTNNEYKPTSDEFKVNKGDKVFVPEANATMLFDYEDDAGLYWCKYSEKEELSYDYDEILEIK